MPEIRFDSVVKIGNRSALSVYRGSTLINFNPRSIFTNNEPGACYDPSDLTTMFQDRAGSQPVTTPGQSVGLILDKSRGLVLGPELVSDSWSAPPSGVTYSAGTFTFDGVTPQTNTVFSTNTPSVAIVVGRTYQVSFTIFSNTTQAVGVDCGGVLGSSQIAAGTYTIRLTATSTTGPQVRFRTSFGVRTGSIGNISVREIPGFHAVANSDAARGIYGIEPFGGRRNLLTFTEASVSTYSTVSNVSDGVLTGFSSALVYGDNSVVRAAYKTTPRTLGVTYTATCYVQMDDGGAPTSGDFTFSVIGDGTAFTASLVSGSLYRVAATRTASETNLVVLTGIQKTTGQSARTFKASGIQLETGSTATNYQRVATAFDVTEAGVPSVHYVQFDGADDGYVTPTINPGTDKAQVFAGVRKLSDGAAGLIAELSPNAAVNGGTFYLTGTNTPGSSTWNSFARGTSLSQAFVNTLPAPSTAVATAIIDISGDTNTLRLNGAQVAQSTADLGTGNFGTHQMFIGRRGGTSLPFNGRLYSLIVRFGPNLSTSEINRVEYYVAQRTGVTF